MTLVCMCMFFSVAPLHSVHSLQHTLGNNWQGEPVCSRLFFLTVVASIFCREGMCKWENIRETVDSMLNLGLNLLCSNLRS